MSGDVLGCGMLFSSTGDYTGVLGFTKNGAAIGFIAADEPVGGFYPAVGMEAAGQAVSVVVKGSWPMEPEFAIARSVPLPGCDTHRRLPHCTAAGWRTLEALWQCKARVQALFAAFSQDQGDRRERGELIDPLAANNNAYSTFMELNELAWYKVLRGHLQYLVLPATAEEGESERGGAAWVEMASFLQSVAESVEAEINRGMTLDPFGTFTNLSTDMATGTVRLGLKPPMDNATAVAVSILFESVDVFVRSPAGRMQALTEHIQARIDRKQWQPYDGVLFEALCHRINTDQEAHLRPSALANFDSLFAVLIPLVKASLLQRSPPTDSAAGTHRLDHLSCDVVARTLLTVQGNLHTLLLVNVPGKPHGTTLSTDAPCPEQHSLLIRYLAFVSLALTTAVTDHIDAGHLHAASNGHGIDTFTSAIVGCSHQWLQMTNGHVVVRDHVVQITKQVQRLVDFNTATHPPAVNRKNAAAVRDTIPSTQAWFTTPLPTELTCLAEWSRESCHQEGPLITCSPQRMEFKMPGAVQFEVAFDGRTELDKHADTLEFTTSAGMCETYGQGVFASSSCLGKTVTMQSTEQLMCEFSASPSNMRWGYKFRVRAMGYAVPSPRSLQACVPWFVALQLTGVEALCDHVADVVWPPATPRNVVNNESEPHHAVHTHTNMLWSANKWGVLFNAVEPPSTIQPSTNRDAARTQQRAEELAKCTGKGKVFIERCRSLRRGKLSAGGSVVNEAIGEMLAVTLVSLPGRLLDAAFDELDRDEADGSAANSKRINSRSNSSHSSSNADSTSNINSTSLLPASLFVAGSALMTVVDKVENTRAALILARQQVVLAQESEDETSGTRSTADSPDAVLLTCIARGTFLREQQRTLPSLAASAAVTSVSATEITQVVAAVVSFIMHSGTLPLDSVRFVLALRQRQAKQRTRALQVLVEAIDQAGGVTTAAGLVACRTIACSSQTHFMDGVDGCGLQVEGSLRDAYFALISCVLKSAPKELMHPEAAVGGFTLPYSALFQLCDQTWKPRDWDHLRRAKIPDILFEGCIRATFIAQCGGPMQMSPCVSVASHRGWLLFAALLLKLGDNVTRLGASNDKLNRTQASQRLLLELGLTTLTCRFELLWPFESLATSALGLLGSLVAMGITAAKSVLTAVRNIGGIADRGGAMPRVPHSFQLPLLHILTTGAAMLGADAVDDVFKCDHETLGTFFFETPWTFCPDSNTNSLDNGEDDAFYSTTAHNQAVIPNDASYFVSFLFEVGTRAVADRRCRLGCEAANAVQLLSQSNAPTTCNTDADHRGVGVPFRTLVAANVESNLPGFGAASNGTSRMDSNMTFALWSIAQVPTLFTPGAEVLVGDETASCTLLRFNPLNSSCAVSNSCGDVMSKPRSSLECPASPRTALRDPTGGLISLDELLARTSAALHLGQPNTSLTPASPPSLLNQSADRMLQAMLYLKTLHAKIRAITTEFATDMDTQSLLKVIEVPSLLNQIVSLARASTKQPADLLLEEMQCLLLYNGSADMADEIRLLRKPQQYVNCSKKFSLYVRAKPDLKSDEIGFVHRGEHVVVIGHEGEWCKLELKSAWLQPSGSNYGWARRVATDREGIRHVMLEPIPAGHPSARRGTVPRTAVQRTAQTHTDAGAAADARASQVHELLSVPTAVRHQAPFTDRLLPPLQQQTAHLRPSRAEHYRRLSLPTRVHSAASALFAQAESVLSGGGAVVRGGENAAWRQGEADSMVHETRRFRATSYGGEDEDQAERTTASTSARPTIRSATVTFLADGNAWSHDQEGRGSGGRVVESSHPVPVGYTTDGSLTIPGALRLRITFDPRCALLNQSADQPATEAGGVAGGDSATFLQTQGQSTHDAAHLAGSCATGGHQGADAIANQLQRAQSIHDTVASSIAGITATIAESSTASASSINTIPVATAVLSTHTPALAPTLAPGPESNLSLPPPPLTGSPARKSVYGAVERALASAVGAKLVLGTRADPLLTIREGGAAWTPLVVEGDTVQFAFAAGQPSAEVAVGAVAAWGFAFTVSVETVQAGCMFDCGLDAAPPTSQNAVSRAGSDAAPPGKGHTVTGTNACYAHPIQPPRPPRRASAATLNQTILTVPEALHEGDGSGDDSSGSYDTDDASSADNDEGEMSRLVHIPTRSAATESRFINPDMPGLSSDSRSTSDEEDSERDAGPGAAWVGGDGGGIASHFPMDRLEQAREQSDILDLLSELEANPELAAVSELDDDAVVRQAMVEATQRLNARLSTLVGAGAGAGGADGVGGASGESGGAASQEGERQSWYQQVEQSAVWSEGLEDAHSDPTADRSVPRSSKNMPGSSSLIDWPVAEVLDGLELQSWAAEVQEAEENSAEHNNSGPRDRSSALLQAILEHPGQLSAASRADISAAALVLQARHLLVDLLAGWPAVGQLTVEHVGGDPGVLFGLFCRMQETCVSTTNATQLQRAVQSVVMYGTRPLLDHLIKLAPECICEPATTKIAKTGPMSYTAGFTLLRDQVYIRGATSLRIRFDPTTFKAFHCDRIIIASSFDLQTNRKLIKYAETPRVAIWMPGSRLYIQYEADEPRDERVPWRFTVEGTGVGFGEVGGAFLSALIDKLGAMQQPGAGDDAGVRVGVGAGVGVGVDGVADAYRTSNGAGSDMPARAATATIVIRKMESPLPPPPPPPPRPISVRPPKGRLRRSDSLDGCNRLDRSWAVATTTSSVRTAAVWRADVLSTLWNELSGAAHSMHGWKLVRVIGMLTSLIQQAGSESRLDLKHAVPVWKLFRRIYVFDSSSRHSATSVLLRALSRFMFVVEDKAMAWGVALELELPSDHEAYGPMAYWARLPNEEENSSALLDLELGSGALTSEAPTDHHRISSSRISSLGTSAVDRWTADDEIASTTFAFATSQQSEVAAFNDDFSSTSDSDSELDLERQENLFAGN
jgi:hypothetical protein